MLNMEIIKSFKIFSTKIDRLRNVRKDNLLSQDRPPNADPSKFKVNDELFVA